MGLRRTVLPLEESERHFSATSPPWHLPKTLGLAHAHKPFEHRFGLTYGDEHGKFELWPARPPPAHDVWVPTRGKTLEFVENVPDPSGEPNDWRLYKFPLIAGGVTWSQGLPHSLTAGSLTTGWTFLARRYRVRFPC